MTNFQLDAFNQTLTDSMNSGTFDAMGAFNQLNAALQGGGFGNLGGGSPAPASAPGNNGGNFPTENPFANAGGGYFGQGISPSSVSMGRNSDATPYGWYDAQTGDAGWGQGPGGMGGTGSLFGGGGYPQQSYPGQPGNWQTGPDTSMILSPGTYGLPSPWGGSGYGGNEGYGGVQQGFQPGNNALSFLEGLGGGVPEFLRMLSGGQALGRPGDMNSTLNQMGQFGGMPSPQSLGNMNWSELQFLQGFFESVLGIPFLDILGESTRPFEGLQTAKRARKRR